MYISFLRFRCYVYILNAPLNILNRQYVSQLTKTIDETETHLDKLQPNFCAVTAVKDNDQLDVLLGPLKSSFREACTGFF